MLLPRSTFLCSLVSLVHAQLNLPGFSTADSTFVANGGFKPSAATKPASMPDWLKAAMKLGAETTSTSTASPKASEDEVAAKALKHFPKDAAAMLATRAPTPAPAEVPAAAAKPRPAAQAPTANPTPPPPAPAPAMLAGFFPSPAAVQEAQVQAAKAQVAVVAQMESHTDSNEGMGLAFDQLGAFPLCQATARRLLSAQDLQTVTNFKPTKSVEEILVCALTIVALLFIWKHRKAALTLLTGDDRVHWALPDACWYGVFQCCGLCKFEWCDCLTNWPCFGRFKGVNPVKLTAQKLGLMSRTVELSNVVVGDLPVEGFGCFYLEIEYGKYPEIVSSVQEDKDPRVVHFPEVLTLRIRESALDFLVHIAVKQVRFVGTSTLCEVRLDPRNVGMWAMEEEPHCTKRFAMTVVEGAEGETPPWISLTFGVEQADLRSLERYRPNLGTTATVRLATWGTHQSATGEMYEEQPLVQMKRDHPLVDGRGNVVQEPREDDLQWVAWLRSCFNCLQSIASMVVGLAFVGYHAFRRYVRLCYGMFETMTIAKSWTPHEFPMPTCALRSIDSVCAAKLDGTGVKPGEHICLPSDEAVEDTCDDPPQPRPKAFGWIVEDLGLGRGHGIKCLDDVCQLNNRIKHYDSVCNWGSMAALIFVFCLFRPLCNAILLAIAQGQQDRRNRRAKQLHGDGI